MTGCCVVGCSTRSECIKGTNLTLHRFPKQQHLRDAWITAINRLDWQPSNSSRVCSRHFEKRCFNPARKIAALYKEAVPTLHLADPLHHHRQTKKLKPKQEASEGVQVNLETNEPSCNTLGHFRNQTSISLDMSDSLTPRNAHIIKVASLENEVEILEQENKSEQVREKETMSALPKNKEKGHDPVEKISAEELPEQDIEAYLVCDAYQELLNLSRGFPVVLNDYYNVNHMHFKNQSISNIIQASRLVSKIVQIESTVQKNETQKFKMLNKISNLEKEIDKFRKQREKDRKRIKMLLQSQRRSLRKIAALKENITQLSNQKEFASVRSEILKKATASLPGISSEKKYHNEVETESRKHTLSVNQFAKNLYSISPDAYKYVQDYFGEALPSENSVSSWICKMNNKLNLSINEDSNDLNSSDLVEMLDLNGDENSNDVSSSDLVVTLDFIDENHKIEIDNN